jgi:hypothetical protein
MRQMVKICEDMKVSCGLKYFNRASSSIHERTDWESGGPDCLLHYTGACSIPRTLIKLEG